MLLAEGVIVVWFVGLIMFGFFGVFLAAISLLLRFFEFIGRSVRGGDRRDGTGAAATLACPHARCGHRNPRMARYCARCGRPLWY